MRATFESLGIRFGEIPIFCTRYYVVDPIKKTINDCASHGMDHAAYKWSPQIDPRWTREQFDAYRSGYETRKAR